MKPVVLAVGLLACCALGAGPKENAGRIDSAVAARVEGGFRGQVAIEVDGVVLLERAYGAARTDPERLAAKDTLYYAGSVAKTMTSAVVLQLVAEKKVALDDPVSKHLSGVPADKARVTIGHLLLHTSGLPANHTNPLTKLDRDAFVAWAMSQPLGAEPGKERAYSNVGYAVLAAIIERIEGSPFTESVRTRVFVPAGMTSTFFLDDPKLPKDRLAWGAGAKLTEQGGTGDPVAFGGTWLRMGCGGIVSTAGDLVRFSRTLREGKILTHDQYWFATTAPAGGSGLGYGWRLSRTRRDTPLHFHDGGFFGFSSGLVRLPDERATIVVLCNREDQAEPVLKDALRDLFAAGTP
jgi:CubicO group peptidase (beta-lactamase class C family)